MKILFKLFSGLVVFLPSIASAIDSRVLLYTEGVKDHDELTNQIEIYSLEQSILDAKLAEILEDKYGSIEKQVLGSGRVINGRKIDLADFIYIYYCALGGEKKSGISNGRNNKEISKFLPKEISNSVVPNSNRPTVKGNSESTTISSTKEIIAKPLSNFDVSYNISSIYTNLPRTQYQAALEKIADLEKKLNKQNLIIKAIEMFANLAIQTELVKFYIDEEKILSKRYKIAKVNYSHEDFLRISSEFTKIKEDRVLAEKDLHDLRSEYSKLTGSNNYNFDFRDFHQIPLKPLPFPVIKNFLDMVEQSNLEIKKSELIDVAEKYNVSAVRRAMAPKVSIEAMRGVDKNQVLVNKDSVNMTSLMLRISVPLYSSVQDFSLIREIKHDHQIKHLEYIANKRRILEEAADIWNNFTSKKAELEKNTSSINSLKIKGDLLVLYYKISMFSGKLSIMNGDGF